MDLINSKIKATLKGQEFSVKYKTRAIDILKEVYEDDKIDDIVAVKINNKLTRISEELVLDSNLMPVTYFDKDGYKIYMRTVKLVLYLAIKRLYKNLNIELSNTIDHFSYFMCQGLEFTDEMAKNILTEMRKIVQANYPIIKKTVDFEEAYSIFKAQEETDKLENMEIKIKPSVSMCFVDGVGATMDGLVAPTTGYAKTFGIKKFRQGFVLIYSDPKNPLNIYTEIEENPVYKVFEEFNKYGEQMGVKTVSDLNQTIIDGKIDEVISLCERIQQAKLDEIIRNIESKPSTKFILVSGPSSSGKTTFAKRISSMLIHKGFAPVIISMDNYFKERIDTPKLPSGEYDFESVDALDMDLFNRDMERLIDGQEIIIPEFNFYTGQKEYKDNKTKMEKNSIYIIEGIHALNPLVTEVLSEDLKYKIYIAPMTTLNLDDFSKVSNTDTRKLRRIIRDYRTRGHSVEKTLDMWKNISVGEKKYIHPFINEANYVFNTSFLYEISVITTYARPLLLQVKTTNENYSEARRLYNFLSNFLAVGDKNIPQNSLLREFIG